MSKSFTCRELGGICDEKLSGDSLAEIMQKGMPHMQSDEAHKAYIATMSERTGGESREQWMERMQREFDAKPDEA